MHSIITKRIPAFYFLLLIPVLVFFFPIWNVKRSDDNSKVTTSQVSSQSSQMVFIRDKNFKLIQPLVLVEEKNEDNSISNLKSTLNQFLQQKIANGEIRAASVYFNDLLNDKHFTINPSEQYCPGSIIKIAVMMTFLKESETNNSLLDKQIFFDSHFSDIPEQHLYGIPLIEKRSYSIRYLISKMIVESNNDAAALLTMNINRDKFVDLFKILSLPKPDLSNWEYFISVEQCSRFLKVLFNGTYLNDENSEYAMGLLTKTTFNNGIQKYIDSSFLIAHKFGERRLLSSVEEHQLHETGIVYFKGKPYVITIMTKGNRIDPLPEVLAQVSKIVFDEQKKYAL